MTHKRNWVALGCPQPTGGGGGGSSKLGGRLGAQMGISEQHGAGRAGSCWDCSLCPPSSSACVICPHPGPQADTVMAPTQVHWEPILLCTYVPAQPLTMNSCLAQQTCLVWLSHWENHGNDKIFPRKETTTAQKMEPNTVCSQVPSPPHVTATRDLPGIQPLTATQ